MFGASYQIAKVWGIPVKIHASLIFLLLYVGISGGVAAGRRYGFATGGLALALNMLLMALVFGSVALHELGHSFVAIRKGCRVRQITLMILGGAAQMDRMPARPRDEISMAAAGPLVSLALGGLAMLGSMRLSGSGWVLPGILLYNLGYINLLLAGFNLLPAFPMDGGRILRAALSGRMGPLAATRIAATIGRWVAVAIGIAAFANGYWIVLAIAFYIFTIAGAEYRMMQIQGAFRAADGFFGGYGSVRDRGDFFETGPPEDDGSVVIGPPPYRKDPPVRIGLRRESGKRFSG